MTNAILDFEMLRNKNEIRAAEWHCDSPGNKTSLEFKAMELGGEVGEVLNAVKKLSRTLNGMKGGVSVMQSQMDIADELADVIICCDLLGMELEIDLGRAVKHKFNKTSDKVGLLTKF